MRTEQGKVYLVGAGPGSVAYLTVAAQNALAQADALVYDALVDPALLALLPPRCDPIQVGKRGGQPSTPQADINRLLVTLSQQGKTVVRLKSGDPFIFGRAAAEIQALKAENCPFEVIPGVSSALAAPLLAGIPLTDPVMSHGFGLFTGHDLDALDWQTLSQLETLVLLMGSRHLADICQQLQSHGKRGDTPVAIIQWASQPQQRLWVGTLLSIVQQTKGQQLSPCVLIIGEVVRLREFLQPPARSALALAGKTVLVTRAAGQSSQFTQLLTAAGAAVVEMPALEIRPPNDWQPLDAAIAALATYDWLLLTSANAVNFFFDRLIEGGQDVRSLASLKIAVVGKKTAAVLRQRGCQADFIPPNYVADSLFEHFPSAAGLRLLFPRVESGGRDVLVKEFSAQGADVTEVAAYESACPAQIAPAAEAALSAGQIDVITFASSKTVRHFAQLMQQRFGDRWSAQVETAAIASIGPQTSLDCRAQLGRVDIEAQTYTLEGLTAALEQWAGAPV
ncbi:MAG: uroporphyrinogen-III C-methyltransferase [Leptolyngbya sp. SIO4C1]|nr:uroporphyrinogen-III C-methyltransferase [Leptolyngbya sp. SIO4C1]